MPKVNLADLVRELRAAKFFLVTSHSNPDGDSIGSILGMYHLLRAMGKTSIICMSDGPVPRLYQWLPGAEKIVPPGPTSEPVEMTVILDVSRTERLGAAAVAMPPNGKVMVIDHHIDDTPCGDFVYIDPRSSAVGEMIAKIYEEAGIAVTREAAECLYVSIATDTGGFRYANTTASAHRIAANLLESGIDVGDISSRVFDVMSIPKYELLRRVLQRAQIELRGRLAYAVITTEDMREFNARNEDADGLVNYLRNIEGVEVGMLFREVDAVTTKVSVRSRNCLNAAKFLNQFGGGGHARAAGATMALSLAVACDQVVDRVRKALGEAA